MATSRLLKNRIRSTKNIRQMTRAMEAVSAVKMRKSQAIAISARPFALSALHILKEVAGRLDQDLGALSPLLQKRTEGVNLYVVITSDKGLAGAFNSQVIRKAESIIKKDTDAKLLTIGKKGRDYFRKRFTVVKDFTASGDFGEIDETRPISDFILNFFVSEKAQGITLIYTNFLSALRQEVVVRKILPIDFETLQDIIDGILPTRGKYANMPAALTPTKDSSTSSVILEPTPATLLASLLPALIEIEILHAILEANASEHAARMVAMKSASDNAGDLMENLTVLYNKARQAVITKELAEITAGKESLQI